MKLTDESMKRTIAKTRVFCPFDQRFRRRHNHKTLARHFKRFLLNFLSIMRPNSRRDFRANAGRIVPVLSDKWRIWFRLTSCRLPITTRTRPVLKTFSRFSISLAFSLDCIQLAVGGRKRKTTPQNRREDNRRDCVITPAPECLSPRRFRRRRKRRTRRRFALRSGERQGNLRPAAVPPAKPFARRFRPDNPKAALTERFCRSP